MLPETFGGFRKHSEAFGGGRRHSKAIGRFRALFSSFRKLSEAFRTFQELLGLLGAAPDRADFWAESGRRDKKRPEQTENIRNEAARRVEDD